MLCNIETNNLKQEYLELCDKLTNENKPLHECPFINCKFLGNYIGLQGTLEEPEAFQIYDLYVCERSKFYKREKMFIAVYGDDQTNYSIGFMESLSLTDNNELKKTATGEAYRRYKNRTICMGIY